MKRVGDAGCVVEMGRQPNPGALGDLDAGEPAGIGCRAPSPQVNCCVSFDHVDHDAGLEIDEAGRVHRRVLAVGFEERRLVDTELSDDADTFGIINQRSAVFDHRVHHCRPTHPELAGETSYRSGVLTDLAARLRTGAARQHHLRVDMIGVLGPRLRVTRVFAAPPPALVPHQPCRPPETREIPDRDRHPIVRLGAHPAARAALDRRGRLDRDHELVGVLGHPKHAEPVQSQQCFRQADTVTHVRGLLVVAAVEQPQRWRDPWPARWTPATSHSPLQCEEPVCAGQTLVVDRRRACPWSACPIRAQSVPNRGA